METIIILIILAVIFIIVARHMPAANKEMRQSGDDLFFAKGKEDVKKMNKVELSEGEYTAKRKRTIKNKKHLVKKNFKEKDKLTIDDVLIKAEELINTKEYEQAEKILIGAVEIDPANDKIYNKLGILYIEQANFSDAKEAFKTALRYDKDNDLTYNNLGLALFNQGRYNEAIEAYQKSIHLNSLIPHRYINLGLSYAALRKYDKALDAYKKALVLDKDNKDYPRLIKEAQEKIEEMKVE